MSVLLEPPSFLGCLVCDGRSRGADDQSAIIAYSLSFLRPLRHLQCSHLHHSHPVRPPWKSVPLSEMRGPINGKPLVAHGSDFMTRKRFDGSWPVFCILLGLFVLAGECPRSWERIARAHALEILPGLRSRLGSADIPISTKAALAAATDEAAPPSAGPSLTSSPQPKPPADKPAVSTPAPAMIQPLQAAASPTAPIPPGNVSAAAPAATASPRAAFPFRASQK